MEPSENLDSQSNYEYKKIILVGFYTRFQPLSSNYTDKKKQGTTTKGDI